MNIGSPKIHWLRISPTVQQKIGALPFLDKSKVKVSSVLVNPTGWGFKIAQLPEKSG